MLPSSSVGKAAGTIAASPPVRCQKCLFERLYYVSAALVGLSLLRVLQY